MNKKGEKDVVVLRGITFMNRITIFESSEG
jgi:hypothetical protein